MFGVVTAVLVGHIPVGYSPMSYFFRVFEASTAKPEVGVERRGEVKTTDFDQIKEKRSPVTTKYNKTHPYLTL